MYQIKLNTLKNSKVMLNLYIYIYVLVCYLYKIFDLRLNNCINYNLI